MTIAEPRPASRTRSLALVLGWGLLLPVAALAQAPDRTGTGGGPDSTITAPNTDSLGVTKPPGTSLGPGEVPAPETQRREREAADRIERGICNGC